MSVQRLYNDFFSFLDHWKKEADPWPFYQRHYLKVHSEFLHAYWKNFEHFDLSQIKGRVRQIKEADYHHLRSLIGSQNPDGRAEEALIRCRSLFPLTPEPDVYLFVGFFSADGKTLDVSGGPVIAIGMERFKDFRDLPLLIAHEYGHCARKALGKQSRAEEGRTLLSSMLSEGLAVLFTEAVYPEIPFHRRLFITPERLRWCEKNQEVLMELAGADLTSEKLIPIFFGPGDPKAGIPPRIGYYLARRMVEKCLTHHGAKECAELFPGFGEIFERILTNRSGNSAK